MRKLLLLSLVPTLLAGLSFANPIGTTPDDEAGLPTAEVPLCGNKIREHTYTQTQGHNDGGVCEDGAKVHFEYQRTVTEHIFEKGSKYYCGQWGSTNQCRADCAAFAACPKNTCSKPAIAETDPLEGETGTNPASCNCD